LHIFKATQAMSKSMLFLYWLFISLILDKQQELDPEFIQQLRSASKSGRDDEKVEALKRATELLSVGILGVFKIYTDFRIGIQDFRATCRSSIYAPVF
jgi:hypothetical protein